MSATATGQDAYRVEQTVKCAGTPVLNRRWDMPVVAGGSLTLRLSVNREYVEYTVDATYKPFTFKVYTDSNGVAVFDATVNSGGPIAITIARFEDDATFQTTPSVLYLPARAAVAKLVLAPAKAHRHLHTGITLSVLALDASSKPVPGARVTFAAVGDCEPVLASAMAVTDAGGRASAFISAKKPGDVAIVAAAKGINGGTLVTPPSRVIFFEDQHDVHHKERRYQDRSWGEVHAYAEDKPDADSDDERYVALFAAPPPPPPPPGHQHDSGRAPTRGVPATP